MSRQGGLSIFLNLDSFIITLGGTLAALFIAFPLKRMARLAKAILKLFYEHDTIQDNVAKLVAYSYKARQKSILALEEDLEREKNKFMKLGLRLLIDGQDEAYIKDVMETEMDAMVKRHEETSAILKSGGRLAPGFGLVGTLIGLISLLRSLGDVNMIQNIGPSMSVALITTFYGALLSNLFFNPMYEKLMNQTEEELYEARVILEGILLIYNGHSPRIVQEKLNSYLPPDKRVSVYEKLRRREG